MYKLFFSSIAMSQSFTYRIFDATGSVVYYGFNRPEHGATKVAEYDGMR
jgi:hypothetical protein